MKKNLILFALLLNSIVSFSQDIYTEIPITGLGEFYFGMNEEEVTKAIKLHATDKTKITPLYEIIAAKELTLAGITFSSASFWLDKDQLYEINFEIDVDTKEAANIFDNLLAVLENDYGKSPSTNSNKNSREWYQYVDDNRYYIKLYKWDDKPQAGMSNINIKAYRQHDFSTSSYSSRDEGADWFGLRVGAGVSTLRGLKDSDIFAGAGNKAIRQRFAWDLGFAGQVGMKNNFFFLTEAIFGTLGARVELDDESFDVDYASFQTSVYLGKNFPIGESTNFFIAGGLYFDFHLATETSVDSETPKYVLDNFKDFDFGGTLKVGLDFESWQIALHPQMGFVDISKDKASKAFNTSLKLAFTYKIPF